MPKPFAVQRQCTCTRFSRFYECGPDGWHEIDQHETEHEAKADAAHMNSVFASQRVQYRAVRRSDGVVLAS